ncbi:predicted protein [Lentinula edodes]|uniref:F-box domain-containing protein n=1 Tax=Lentinula edodes TaxID=5353 RepID=A0A1Q3EHX4_LENED|nr:predicted protein [Lentinula edodes]
MLLSDLPNDIIIIVLHSLPVPDLSALSRTSKSFYQLVNAFGWQIHIRCNPRPSFSLAQAREIWKPRRRLQKQQPMLAINNIRLVVAAGNTIYAYAFGTPKASGSPPLRFEGSLWFRSGIYATQNQDGRVPECSEPRIVVHLCMILDLTSLKIHTLSYRPHLD